MNLCFRVPRTFLFPLLSGVLALSACAANTIEDAVPKSAAGPASAVPAAPPEPATSGMVEGASGVVPGTATQPRDTGGYPNLNIPQKAETSQFTPQDLQTKKSALAAARQKNAAATPPDAAAIGSDAATLKTLGQTHAQNALKEIESQ